MTEPNWKALNQYMNNTELPEPQTGEFVFDVNETMVSVNDKTMTLAQYVRMVALNQITEIVDSVYPEAKPGSVSEQSDK